jgi:hypothetical protein
VARHFRVPSTSVKLGPRPGPPCVHSPHHRSKDEYQHYAQDHEVSQRKPRAPLRFFGKVTRGLSTSAHARHTKYWVKSCNRRRADRKRRRPLACSASRRLLRK